MLAGLRGQGTDHPPTGAMGWLWGVGALGGLGKVGRMGKPVDEGAIPPGGR